MVCESLWVGRTQKEWEMGKLCYLGASDEETKPKTEIYAKKLSKIDFIEKFSPLVKKLMVNYQKGQHKSTNEVMLTSRVCLDGGPLIGSESGWIGLSLIIRWCVKHYWQGANVANLRNEMGHKLTRWIGVLMRLQACKMTWHRWCVNDVRGMVKAWKCMKTLGGEWNQWQACGSVWHYGFSDHWISQFCRSNNGEDIKVVCMANGWAMCEIPEGHVNRPQNL